MSSQQLLTAARMASRCAGIAHQPHGQSTIEYLELEEVKVQAWVVDVSSRIILTQTFYNQSDTPTGRAKYVFPLPANAAVCAFELELEDGSVIIGEVKEKEEAALAFTGAVNQGKTAALVERVTDDIFTISVGSIPAMTRVMSHLTFVMDLLDEGLHDHIRLQLPMYIAERYGTPPATMHDASQANSRTRVHINVDVQTSDVIHAIRSPTHKISLRRYKGRSGRKSERRMSAEWKSPDFLTSDFVITVYAEGLDKPRCFAEVLDVRGEGGDKSTTIAMELTLVPKFQAPKIPSQEYIFIIDRSGSMGGAPIETAKRTLAMLLRLLPKTQTTFNIFSFGDTATGLWTNSRLLDRSSLAEATSHVARMNADYGGTEIPGALQSAFNSRALDRPAVLFLLTDGQIHGNEALDPFVVVSTAIRNSPPQASARLFVLGIGAGVSSDVCSRLADEGHGDYLFADSVVNISGKCARLLNAGRSENIERIDIDWGQAASSPPADLSPITPILPAGITALAPSPLIQQAPHSLTKIFSGIRFTVFAIISSRTVPTSVRLRTKLQGVTELQELVLEVAKVKPFRDTNEHSTIPILHTLAARKLIMELDVGVGPLPAPAPEDALMVSSNDLRKAGIVRLALAYRLVSKHTSFVAIQKGDERRRSMRRRSYQTAWARSRLQGSDRDAEVQNDNHPEPPTFLDGVINEVYSLFLSVFGSWGGAATGTPPRSNTVSHSRPRRRPQLPGAFDGSDAGSSDNDVGRGRRRSIASPRRSPSAHSSTPTFSTLSSLDGSSSCSACWTPSRSPSPLPVFPDPIVRAPSPVFHQDPIAPNPSVTTSRRQQPISQEVHELYLQMELDGSFTASPLLRRLVGNAVLGKADELGKDHKVWATIVVVAYMQIHLQSEPDLLELLSEKAKEFVQASGHDARQFDQMVRDAAALLNP